MSGFDTPTPQHGVFAQTKQFGSILRGFGPPVPQAGVLGDLYVDVQTWQFFEKRMIDSVAPWGHYLFVVPLAYRTSLKWFSTGSPPDTIGLPGDYCLLWGGFANYGMQPSVYGPKQSQTWPENGIGSPTIISALGAGTVLPVGLLGEGAAVPESNSTQLVAVGIDGEAILPMPVLDGAGQPVYQLGLQSGPRQITVEINELYAATDGHSV